MDSRSRTRLCRLRYSPVSFISADSEYTSKYEAPPRFRAMRNLFRQVFAREWIARDCSRSVENCMMAIYFYFGVNSSLTNCNRIFYIRLWHRNCPILFQLKSFFLQWIFGGCVALKRFVRNLNFPTFILELLLLKLDEFTMQCRMNNNYSTLWLFVFIFFYICTSLI